MASEALAGFALVDDVPVDSSLANNLLSSSSLVDISLVNDSLFGDSIVDGSHERVMLSDSPKPYSCHGSFGCVCEDYFGICFMQVEYSYSGKLAYTWMSIHTCHPRIDWSNLECFYVNPLDVVMTNHCLDMIRNYKQSLF